MATTVSGETAGPTRIDYSTTLDGRTKALILAGVLLGLFLAALDQTIVATALPRIVADLQGIDLLAWVTTSYLLASTTMVPIYGKMSDIYGRKVVLISGIVLFLIGSALCGLAPTMLLLVIFRAIQGLGAAALTSTAFAIPADLFPPIERPRYTGLFGAVFGLSSVVGPLLGGFITDTISWHWVFYVNLPLGLIALGFIMAQMPALKSGLGGRIDFVGSVLLVVTTVPLLLALTLDKNLYGWTSPLILGMFATSAAGLGLFLWQQTRSSAPIISLRLFRNRVYALISLISFLFGAAFFAAILFLSLYLINVQGVSATAAGTATMPLTFALVVSSLVSSVIVQRMGRYKAAVLVGLLIVALGFYLLSTMAATTPIWLVSLYMVVLGLGLGPALPLLTLAIQNAVSFNEIGAATASRQFFQQLGQAIGAAIFGVILTNTLTAAITTNLQPLTASLPAALASQFDPGQLRNGTGGEATGDAVSVEQRIQEGIRASFTEQRALIERALVQGDQAAIEALLHDPQTPEQFKALLQSGSGQPVPSFVVDRINASLDQAEQQALTEGATVGRQIDAAIKDGFTQAVTRVYLYAIPIVLLAFVMMLFVPDLRLRRSNTETPAMAFE